MFHLRLACCVLCIKFLKYVNEEFPSFTFVNEGNSSFTIEEKKSERSGRV